ncbi:MAG: NADH-quinone oxidoreductase subunit I [Bacteroidota bacterium]|nr:NADH-quinone oxidoreductase subunit I [Bacteroidota bacterium]
MAAVALYFSDIYRSLRSIVIGMGVTINQMFQPVVTLQYPIEKKAMPERVRNRLYMNFDDCIGCELCANACPVDCIDIEVMKAPATENLGVTSTGQKKRIYVTKFDIDIAKCCYCGLCVYPCPTECLKMTDVYEFSEFDRHNLIYNFSTMTPSEIETAKGKIKVFEEEQAAKKAAAAAQAAAAKAAAPVPPSSPDPSSQTPPPPANPDSGNAQPNT